MAKRGGTDDERRARGEQTSRDLIKRAGLFVEQGLLPHQHRRPRLPGPGWAHAAPSTTTSRTRRSCFAPYSKRWNKTSPAVACLPARGDDPVGAPHREACTAFSRSALVPEVQRSCSLMVRSSSAGRRCARSRRANSIALIERSSAKRSTEEIIDEQPVQRTDPHAGRGPGGGLAASRPRDEPPRPVSARRGFLDRPADQLLG